MVKGFFACRQTNLLTKIKQSATIDDLMSEEYIGKDKKVRRAYGFDDVSIVPGIITVDPEDVDTTMRIGDYSFSAPFLASAMDGVVDVKFAVAMGKLGGLAVLNLNGLQTRYDNPEEILSAIPGKSPAEVTAYIKEIYKEPIKEELIGRRVREIRDGGVICAVSSVPMDAEKFGEIALDAGVDIFVIQSTVTSVRHESSKAPSLDIAKFCGNFPKPVLVGNCVTYDVAYALMEAGAAGILVGIGPGAACTTRGVLGIGVPQITSTVDTARARDDFKAKTGREVAIITDGGMRTGGDICKALVAGADSVMIGSPFAKAEEAPGGGYHWGMATSHAALPRGTRVQVGVHGTLENILIGPALGTDGTQNLLGSVKNCMGLCGSKTLAEFHEAELIVSNSFMTEGKLHQMAQKVGMGR